MTRDSQGWHIAMLRDRARVISIKDKTRSGRDNALRAAIEDQREDEEMGEQDYPYVRAWEKMMGGNWSYAQEQLARARRDKAPANATHINQDGKTWSTTDDVIGQGTRQRLGLEPLTPTAPAVLKNYHAEIISQQQATGLDEFKYEIEFPTVRSASTWASEYRITAQVTMTECDRFDLPVTVRYTTWEE